MGIFSLFGKKDNQLTKPDGSSRAKRQTSTARAESGKAVTRPANIKRDAQAARATALKIDAIESEMSSEFVTTTRSGNTVPSQTTGTPPPQKAAPPASGKVDLSMQTTVPLEAVPTQHPMATEMGTTTAFLLKGQTAVGNVAGLSSEAAAVIEETAIMYANGQNDLVGQMLQSAIDEDRLGDVTIKAWWMLFDLYQITGKKQEFEQLSIAYANKFETSPPTWHEQGKSEAGQEAPAGATPMVPFSGKLNASSVKPIERIQKLAETYRTLRLEFARVTEVDPEGCRLLLALLKKLQKAGHELILVGASELAGKIRAILEVGRRDHEDSWLLLLEILQLLNREQEFEETSIDYCVTFEVSPPAFSAPKNVTTATVETPAEAPEEGFMMPPLVEGRIDNLILAIAAYSDEHCPAIMDCSQLTRVDFAAAGRLLTGLAPFCGNGKVLEFHHVNHLVSELFKVIGLQDIARVLPRKN